MFRAILIDDEINSTELTTELIKMYTPESVEVIASFNNPVLALEKISTLKPDIVFLDIEMPKMNGFEFLERLQKVDFEIIFLTAYSSFAVKAIQYAALDYLLKPLYGEDLKECISSLTDKMKYHNKETRLRALKSNIAGSIKHISVPVNGYFELLEVSKITHIEGDRNYSRVHTTDRSFHMAKTLKQHLEVLGDTLIRCHKSTLVNTRYIERIIKKNGVQVELAGGHILSVSKSYTEAVLSYQGRK